MTIRKYFRTIFCWNRVSNELPNEVENEVKNTMKKKLIENSKIKSQSIIQLHSIYDKLEKEKSVNSPISNDVNRKALIPNRSFSFIESLNKFKNQKINESPPKEIKIMNRTSEFSNSMKNIHNFFKNKKLLPEKMLFSHNFRHEPIKLNISTNEKLNQSDINKKKTDNNKNQKIISDNDEFNLEDSDIEKMAIVSWMFDL
ncbi:hypothetical protein HERIO_2173 [Hepatospora eriocheir]|uniref:Uncharacterized protein n=1 Tax=Hepatospora eriocheir TaxID=1081669 RepID=A0A1X0Q7W4_9MICR|nr:hypothetical protein HERIO_2173 [Hepatospora eriocheir]